MGKLLNRFIDRLWWFFYSIKSRSICCSCGKVKRLIYFDSLAIRGPDMYEGIECDECANGRLNVPTIKDEKRDYNAINFETIKVGDWTYFVAPPGSVMHALKKGEDPKDAENWETLEDAKPWEHCDEDCGTCGFRKWCPEEGLVH